MYSIRYCYHTTTHVCIACVSMKNTHTHTHWYKERWGVMIPVGLTQRRCSW